MVDNKLLLEQKKLQESSYQLLQERIEKIIQNKESDVLRIAKARGLLKYIKYFMDKIDDFLSKYLSEIVI